MAPYRIESELNQLQAQKLKLDTMRTADENNARFRHAVEDVRQKLPELLAQMPPDAHGKKLTEQRANSMLQYFTREHAASTNRLKNGVAALHATGFREPLGPQGPQGPRGMEQRVDMLKQKYDLEFGIAISERYGAQGEALLQAVKSKSDAPQQEGKLQQGGKTMSRNGTPSNDFTNEMENIQQRQLKLNLERTGEAHNAVFRHAVENVRQKLPELLAKMPPDANGEKLTEQRANSMLQDFTREYEASTERLKGRVAALYASGPKESLELKREMQMLNKKNDLEFRVTMRERYGAQGEALLREVGNESEALQQGPIGKMISKIGTTGGLIGAAVAGVGLFMGMGGFGGGILAMLGLLGGVLIGGTVGGTINGWVTSKGPWHSSTAVSPDQQGHGQAQSSGQETGPKQAQDTTRDTRKDTGRETDMTTGDLTPSRIPAPPPSSAARIR